MVKTTKYVTEIDYNEYWRLYNKYVESGNDYDLMDLDTWVNILAERYGQVDISTGEILNE